MDGVAGVLDEDEPALRGELHDGAELAADPGVVDEEGAFRATTSSATYSKLIPSVSGRTSQNPSVASS